MYVFVGLTNRRSRKTVNVSCDVVSKSDSDAVCRALEWQLDFDEITVVEVWDEKEAAFVCSIEV